MCMEVEKEVQREVDTVEGGQAAAAAVPAIGAEAAVEGAPKKARTIAGIKIKAVSMKWSLLDYSVSAKHP